MRKYNYHGNTEMCDSDIISKFDEDIFADILIDTALGVYSAKDAVKLLRKKCGLKMVEFKMINSFELPDFLTERYIELFAVRVASKPKLLEMCVVNKIEGWLDIFCLSGSFITLIECAEDFYKTYNIYANLHSKIKELEEDIKRRELTLEIYHKCFGIQEKMICVERPDKNKEGYVYLINAGDVFKIGVSIDVESRLSYMQTGCPLPMRLVSKYKAQNICKLKIEKALHDYFSEYRLSGEWFDTDISETEFQLLCSLFDK